MAKELYYYKVVLSDGVVVEIEEEGKLLFEYINGCSTFTTGENFFKVSAIQAIVKSSKANFEKANEVKIEADQPRMNCGNCYFWNKTTCPHRFDDYDSERYCTGHRWPDGSK